MKIKNKNETKQNRIKKKKKKTTKKTQYKTRPPPPPPPPPPTTKHLDGKIKWRTLLWSKYYDAKILLELRR